MTHLPEKPYYRVDEVASYFDVSRSNIYRQMDEGKIAFIFVGSSNSKRIPRSEIERMEKINCP